MLVGFPNTGWFERCAMVAENRVMDNQTGGLVLCARYSTFVNNVLTGNVAGINTAANAYDAPSDLTISNNIIAANAVGIRTDETNPAVRCRNIIISNNVVVESVYSGILWNNVDNLVVANNTVQNNNLSGTNYGVAIGITSSQSVTVSGNIIANDLETPTEDRGIVFQGVSNGVVSSNVIRRIRNPEGLNKTGILSLGLGNEHVTVSANVITDCGIGLLVNSTADVVSTGNQFSANTTDIVAYNTVVRTSGDAYTTTSLSGAMLVAADGLQERYYGSGSPENVIAARVGSTYIRSDGAAGTTFYVKESGTGATGWSAK